MMNLTPNQLVAYNLQRIRRELALTQDEAADRLEPHIGSRWSKAVWSAAETSVLSERRREFTADEIVAFARAFDVPIAWFFMPPDAGTLGIRAADMPPDLLDLLFGSGQRYERLWSRLQGWLAANPKRSDAGSLSGAWLGKKFRDEVEARMGPINDLAGYLNRLAHALVQAGQETTSEAVKREAHANPGLTERKDPPRTPTIPISSREADDRRAARVMAYALKRMERDAKKKVVRK